MSLGFNRSVNVDWATTDASGHPAVVTSIELWDDEVILRMVTRFPPSDDKRVRIEMRASSHFQDWRIEGPDDIIARVVTGNASSMDGDSGVTTRFEFCMAPAIPADAETVVVVGPSGHVDVAIANAT
jgi:hypothetical protein